MPEDAVTLALRGRVIFNARQYVGAHYLWGAAGATPGGQDGARYRPDGVHLHPNDPNPDPTDDGRRHPIFFTATSRYAPQGHHQYNICNGRRSDDVVAILIHGDLRRGDDPTYAVNQFSWPRPNHNDRRILVWGESCLGFRHFDCIHFINYCLNAVCPWAGQRGIQHWINLTRDVGFDDMCAADILTRGDHHIGFYTGDTTGGNTVVHAKGTDWGVIEETFTVGSWDRCGRLRRAWWLHGTPTPEPDSLAQPSGAAP